MDLLDESGEIRATAFNEQCDKFYDMIEVRRIIVYHLAFSSALFFLEISVSFILAICIHGFRDFILFYHLKNVLG